VIGVIGTSGSGKSFLLRRAIHEGLDLALSEGREAEVIVRSREHLAVLAAWSDCEFRGGQSPKLKYVPANPRRVTGAAGSAAEGGVLAVLADLNDAVTTHQPDYLIVLSSDLPTTGALDLGKENDPHRQVHDLDNRGVVFPDLRGRTVVFVGLTSEHSRTYWRAVCETSGADTFGVAVEPTEYRHVLKLCDTPHPKPSWAITALTHAISDWGSTFRTVLVVTAIAISAVGTILVLGLANLSGYTWLAPLAAFALYLGIRLTRQMTLEARTSGRETPIVSRRSFEEVV
jgi:hypothetical protein